MKIDKPGGGGFKVPDGDRPDKVQGPQGPDFQSRMDEAEGTKRTEGAARAEGPRTSELRQILADLGSDDPGRLETATGRMVDWVLKDTYGEQILEGPKADELRAAIREQLLDDPTQSARIQKILDRL